MNMSFWVITKYRSFFRKTNQLPEGLHYKICFTSTNSTVLAFSVTTLQFWFILHSAGEKGDFIWSRVLSKLQKIGHYNKTLTNFTGTILIIVNLWSVIIWAERGESHTTEHAVKLLNYNYAEYSLIDPRRSPHRMLSINQDFLINCFGIFSMRFCPWSWHWHVIYATRPATRPGDQLYSFTY